MEDLEEGEGEGDEGDGDGDGDGDDNGDGDGDGDNDGDVDMDGEDEGDGDDGDEDGEDDDQPESPSPNGPVMANGTASAPIRSPSHPASTSFPFPIRPAVRADMVAAKTYDIVPTMAAPQSTSINAVCATPDMRWVFTGGSDGYIRKFNWIDTANGKLALTVAQKHPFVDSVIKAGVLASYWENEDLAASILSTPPRHPDESVRVSPVYSLAVHHQALWLLSGDETGGISLQTVRHSEGHRITTLKQHTSAVSVLNMAPDERSVLSGSWDKAIHDWDLNVGQVKRSFSGSGGQISSIELRPESSLPVPNDTLTSIVTSSDTFSSNNADKPSTNGALLNTTSEDQNGTTDTYNEDELDSLFGDDGPAMGELGDDEEMDEFSRAIANEMQQGDDTAEPQADTVDVSVTETIDATQSGDGSTSETVQGSSGDADGQSSNKTPPTSDQILDPPIQSNPTQDSLPHSDEPQIIITDSSAMDVDSTTPSISSDTFLDASMDGSIRVWDRRQPNPIARITPQRGTPPWCMSACWSPDGNFIYAGRRNNAVEEYSLHKGLREPNRTFKFPAGSGAVSAVRAMPNGKHLVCASYDILRLYDLEAPPPSRHTGVPFLIVPGHRTGVISQLYLDPTCTFLISTAGNRGWEGASTEVMLGYEIGIPA
jgi:transcriptional activator SPT8